jgi:hypothetical protein
MKLHLPWLVLVAVGLGAGDAFGQQSTVVQLPTFSHFSTNTTVSVPDRGSVFLGGVHRAATGRNEFGVPLLPFGNRSFGTERSTSGTRVSVYIHDFEAMDRYLLSQPTPFRAAQQRAAGLAAGAKDAWPRRLEAAQAGSARPSVMSVAQLRAQHLHEQQAQEDEARQWYERGLGAEAAGKANVARVYYQMAARRAGGELKAQIAARLESLASPPAASNLAQRQP